ncbi:TetR/AcrR family transcriptional regulator [Sinomonas halotolerans]|uniref:TetR/AcrR family transcriptional regulator n=1 Tax=Sinomonas halotolerans TaxID=1644133 RepID=A0ABU9X068_9MICC
MAIKGTGRSPRGPYAKTAERRRQIAQAALEVFGARGYRGGTVQEVADRVGMSQTSVLHHFPTKAALLVAALEHRDAIADESPGTGDRFAESVVRQAEHNEGAPGLIELYAVLCGESTTEGHPARTYFEERFERLRSEYAEELRHLAEAGRLRPGVDPETAGTTLLALWDGIQVQWLFAPAEIDMAATLKAYLDLIMLPAPAAPAPAAPADAP